MTKRIDSVLVDFEAGDDADLIRCVSNGDEAALSLLYDRYRRVLFGLLYRMLNNRTEAEDVLQEVFVQVWRQARKFDEGRGKAFTWLVTIARRRAIDRLRSLRSRAMTIYKASESNALYPDAAVEQDPFLRADQKTVRAALNQLPAAQRSLLLMAFFEGRSQREIAERTKIPLGTIKTRIRTGMTRLRETLDPDLNNR